MEFLKLSFVGCEIIIIIITPSGMGKISNGSLGWEQNLADEETTVH